MSHEEVGLSVIDINKTASLELSQILSQIVLDIDFQSFFNFKSILFPFEIEF
jgi:hypothetical protein